MSEHESEGVKITDKRKLDPETGEPRVVIAEPEVTDEVGDSQATVDDRVAELTADVQRIQAEFINYRKRVERDREAMRDHVVASTLAEFLPVLDDVGRARAHGELDGAFKSVGEALESTITRLGLIPFGEVGDEFDPTRHEAISHEYSAEAVSTTCANVFQQGFEYNDRVIRAAIVSVVEPGAPAQE